MATCIARALFTYGHTPVDKNLAYSSYGDSGSDALLMI